MEEMPDIDGEIIKSAHDCVDAYAFLQKVEMAWSHDNMPLSGVLRVELSGLRRRARHHLMMAMSTLGKLSRRSRGILPHGTSGQGPLFPPGTRGYSELSQLQDRMLAIVRMRAASSGACAPELMIGHEMYLFATYQDALLACAAMVRGARLYGAADPHQSQVRVGMSPIECRIQRRMVAAPMKRAVAALGEAVHRGQITLPSVRVEPLPAREKGQTS